MKTIEGRNELFPFIMGILLVAGGSASTLFYYVSAIFLLFMNPKIGVASLWKQVLKLYISHPVLLVFPVFVLSLFLFSIGKENTEELLETLASHFQLLFIVPIVIGLTAISRCQNSIEYFINGLHVGIITILPLALLQVTVFDTRPEGLSGNSLIFAFVLCLACVLGMLKENRHADPAKYYFYIPSICAFFMIIISFSRAPILIVLTLTIVTLCLHVRRYLNIKQFSSVVLMFTVILALGIATISMTDFGARYFDKRIVEPLTNLVNGDLSDNSINKRIDLNVSGFQAFLEKPLAGYGLQNTVNAANEASEKALGKKTDYAFSHLHNEYLTYAVAGGIFILLQYLIIMSVPFLIGKNQMSFGFPFIVIITFMAIALTNVVLAHDITATFFSMCVIVILLSRLNNEKKEKLKISHY